MQTEKEDDDDASVEEYVALSNFTGGGSNQVETDTDAWSNNCTSVPLVSAAGTRCSCTPRLLQSGGGRAAGGRRVCPRLLPAPAAEEDEEDTSLEDPWQDEEYFGSYGTLRLHLEMLSDRRRTEAYRQVILSNSAPLRNKVVMDLGCGTGIISLFCAQLARPLTGNVNSSASGGGGGCLLWGRAPWPRQLVKQNGCEEVVTVLQGRAEDIHLPERVDILVSEWMGNCLLFEFMVESVLLARDRWLKEALTLVPCQANSYYAEKMAFWEQPYGLDCTPLHYLMICVQKFNLSFALFSFNSHLIDPSDCLTAPCDVLRLDMYTLEIKDLEANALEADSVHAGPAGQSFGGRLHRWNHRPAQEPRPALYAYNNAAFTDEDWEGIQMAGRSVKRNDPNKVGRFGIGFNSVYHITDVPSIFSSDHLGMMDPQEKTFGQRNSGFLWSLDDAEHQKALIEMHDQKEWSTVINKDQHFDGTIFRFPLRKEASDISDNLYDSDRVVELFDSFIADADLSLLFLKNVTSVSLIHINMYGTVKTRLEVKSSMSTDVVLESEDDSIIESSTRFKVITLNSEDHKETKWLLTTCTMKEGNVEHLDSLAKKLSFFPQVDLAFPCGEKRDSSESRLSCFLPLPNNESNKTGLPVYINACFGLTDNRREIKWQEEDQQHDEHAVWNELLMKEVLPQAYIMIIQDAINLAQQDNLPVSSVYDLWPDIAQIKHKRKWYAVARDVLDLLFRQNVAVLSLAKDEREFITPSEAVFPCNGPTSSDILAAIKRTLVSCGENLVTLPGSVASAIVEAYPHLDTLKHGSLRRIDVHTISKPDKLCLLEFILSDEKYRELEGLQLLPLNDGSFRSFTDREEDTALIDSNEFPRVLLPFCKHLFIPDNLRPACSAHLKELARENIFKVINIDAKRVAEYTKRFLPQDWKQMSKGHVTWDVSSNQHPPLEWLQEFWTFLNTHFKELSHFIGLPLIPVSPLSVSQPVSLATLEQKTTLIFQKRKQMNLPEKITELVNKLGGTAVRENDWLKHDDLDSYVLCPSPRSVMKVLGNLDSQNLIRDLKTASHGAREELKDYLSRLDCLSVTEKDLLSKLPLFQTMNGSCVAAQSKQAVLLMSGLKVPTDFPMPASVVRCATEADRRLLQLLKVKLLDTAEAAHLLIDCIESRACRKEDTEKIMTWILQNGAILFSQNQTLKHRCKDLSFIEVNGELKKPSAFFDPRIKTFKVVFESDFFPPPLYTGTSQMLQSLTDLGLLNKEVDVSPEHFLHAATLIDKAHVDSQTEALNRAQVLLKMLDTNDLFKFSPEQLIASTC
ncbi:hypothetical protein F7725_001880 [Dissostichus mawsoni]|uniref:type I protein arginine methyltransferase n=1 Tax=Dissostichus mawsoni TaxID=36200 RepID=A0A7J5Y1T2_DISMA|nr:hypothetical protein F7725_001880 [Dissostichus mawsoni]